ncbi:hypothetical protein Mucpa_1066 [Mucilaginibacter paludis DSM 18603]|uniref:Uncharacterized protein n=1 Tax=Mucilaginibacter paludis DSM 18603 TaxID=714943 RepID=H1YEY5_9SPHI|nr:hypothetical protein Mucpa_1066 [Mucilaginibacter paludis DSM 18603]
MIKQISLKLPLNYIDKHQYEKVFFGTYKQVCKNRRSTYSFFKFCEL